MKKLAAICLAVITSVFATTSVFAANVSDQITDDTIITGDNIYAVAEYLGLGSDAVVPQETTKMSTVTVGDLKEKMAIAATQPRRIYCVNDAPLNDEESMVAPRASGTKTVYYNSQVGGSIGITYSVTGTYYKGTSLKYWKTVTNSSISADPTNAPYFHQIDAIHEQSAVVENAYSSSSNIKFSYNYDVGSYLGVEGFAIRYWQVNIDGYTNFQGSTYL